MKKILLTILVPFILSSSYSQIAKDFMVNGHVDLIKSDNSGYFEKIQASIEGNYFLSRKFTATTGVEYWSDGNEASFIIGGRWCPISEAFVRLRGLIGANDISIGGGWAKPLKNNWRFEALGDVYTKGHIAIRVGFAYVIRMN